MLFKVFGKIFKKEILAEAADFKIGGPVIKRCDFSDDLLQLNTRRATGYGEHIGWN